MRTTLSLLFTLSLVPLSACDDGAATVDDTDTTLSDTTPSDTSPSDTSEDVAEEVLADALSTQLSVTATFTAAVSTGQNHLRLVVLDQLGRHLPGATFTVVPTMPMHGHGSTETPVVSDLGQGEYDAFPVTFQMPGMWKVAIDATLGDLSTHLDLDLTVP